MTASVRESASPLVWKDFEYKRHLGHKNGMVFVPRYFKKGRLVNEL